MKLLLLLTLSSALCYGQEKNIIGLNAGYDIHIGVWTGQLSTPWVSNSPKDTFVNIFYGAQTMDEVTTGDYSVPLGKRHPTPDTPLADRNPNDFYGDSLVWDLQRNKMIGVYPIHDRTPKPKVLSLEEKLLLYAEECYNDSTHTQICCGSESVREKVKPFGCGYERYIGNSLQLEWSCNKDFVRCTIKTLPSHYKYIHRKPTFEHFIEWLKKK